MLFIIDIDGTVADASLRFEKAGPEPKNREDKEAYRVWVDAVNSGMENDQPVAGMAAMSEILNTDLNEVVYVTGREETHREITEEWLTSHQFAKAPLVMRPKGSWVSNVDFKEIAIKSLLAMHSGGMGNGCNDVVVVDDDEHNHIERMCKRNGWTFLKARSGGQK